ncbi:MAG: DNA internalization-related competence protein ComEC/Rec2 [Undibacterium sp.]|nr:DNA internalization-related competence protein ComEC/Rec2 [Undibacterium sp.]
MRSATIAFVVGVTLLQQQAWLWDKWILILCLILLLVLPLIWYGMQMRLPKFALGFPRLFVKFIFILLAGLGGFAWAGLFAHHYLSEELAAEWEARDVIVIGVVDSLPSRTAQGSHFNFVVEKVIAPPELVRPSVAAIPHKLALGWFVQRNNLTLGQEVMPEVKPGERWRFTVRLKRPHGNANPYGFDYEAWLLEQGLRATGAIREGDALRLNDFVWSLSNVIERCRFSLRERIVHALPNAAYAGVLVALVVGDQHEVTPNDWKVFNRTGIGHLISISGLHITMIAGLFAGLMNYLWRRSFFTRAQLPLLLPTSKVTALSGALAALVYVALAGFGVPAQRTLLMLIVVALALWTNRMSSLSHVLCAALAVVVLFDPWSVLWPGFWLSYGAVGTLIYACSGRLQIAPLHTAREKLRAHFQLAVRTQYAVTVGLVPLPILLFGQLSLISPIANALAIPFISFVVTPLALIGSVLPTPLSAWVLWAAHACVSLLASILTYLSSTPFAVWNAPVPSFWMFVLAMLGILWVLAPRAWPMRFLGGFCCLPLIVNPSTTPKMGEMSVTAFDVGQGAAVLIETEHHRLLYDTGPGFSEESNSGTRVLLPYFQARGIGQLDRLMISHADNDHSGGALSVMANLKVDDVMSSLKLEHPIVLAARIHQRCEAGQEWDWDGVHFEILHPVAVIYTSDKWKTNALSCTIKISTKTHSLLLAGDIEALQEDQLVNRISQKLKANILLAPHHGSGTSSTLAFLQAVQPDIALFQVGYLNRYHHPKAEVMQRYIDFGIKPLRTDKSGAITLQFGDTLTVEKYREVHARYWYEH